MISHKNMDKIELLTALSEKVKKGEISPAEITDWLGLTPTNSHSTLVGVSSTDDKPATFSLNKILYLLGAAIAVVGIFIFIAQIWDDIGSFGRISTTLGLGLLLALLGSSLLKSKPEENIGTVFHIIGGLLIPGGAMVTLSELKVETVSMWPLASTFGFIMVFYLLLNYVHKHPVLTFFAIFNGTVFLHLLLQAVTGYPDYLFEYNIDIFTYLTMLIGVSYLLLAHAFRDSWNQKLIVPLNFFGSLGILGAGFSQALDYKLWEWLFFLMLFGGVALAVYFRSRTILLMSTIFLIAHVSYITSEYFADSLGWPISLVLLGFVFIGLGYLSVKINQKYIAS